jgi:molybdopterin synthase catalytic subunit
MAAVTGDNWLDLLASPLVASDALAFATSPACGAIDIFLGTTRAEITDDRGELIALDYEAYDTMARRQLADLADQARKRWPLEKLVILHRIGRVSVSEPSVLIAVSTPHRADAFEACRWLIDELKKTVTIWKQEVWADGSTRWVMPANQPG